MVRSAWLFDFAFISMNKKNQTRIFSFLFKLGLWCWMVRITHSVSACVTDGVCVCAQSVRELSVVLNPSVTPYIWERTRKITQNPSSPALTSEWQQQILLHASNTYVNPCTRSVHNSAQFSKQNVRSQASVGSSIRVRWFFNIVKQ